MQCEQCGKQIEKNAGGPIRFCPFCGARVGEAASGTSDLESRLRTEKKPKRKYEMIMAVLSEFPDDFEANKALLFHGRLHEPMTTRHAVDYSVIKCHLLSVFHTPEAYAPDVLSSKLEELLRGPQLQKTMALSPDAELFFSEYMRRLAFEYVDLFIRGDSRNSTFAFGIPRSGASMARSCAVSVRRMLSGIAVSDHLSETERMLIESALRDAYARVFSGYQEELDN